MNDTDLPHPKRIVDIYVKDNSGDPISDSTIEFFVNNQPAGRIEKSGGHGNIRLPELGDSLRVEATYKKQKKSALLSGEQKFFNFFFEKESADSSKELAAFKMLTLIIIVVGVLGVLFLLTGVVFVAYNATGSSQMKFMGLSFETGSAGVACVLAGVVVILFTIRPTLKLLGPIFGGK